jgi:hypothetical protein
MHQIGAGREPVSAALQSQNPALPAGARSTATGCGIVIYTGPDTALAEPALDIPVEPELLKRHEGKQA